MADIPSGSVEHFSEPLSEREREILAFLAGDLSNQQIANALHLAEKTVRWYSSQIYRKLGVRNREKAMEGEGVWGMLGAASADSLAQGNRNLPYQITPFVGRQREKAKIYDLLTDPNVRLLTILAPGGMGKTRLA